MKHTPGEWELQYGHQTSRIYAIKGITRWNFLLKGASEESQANARLIAQAPNLLFTLKGIINDLPTNRDWLDPDLERLARDAIAKAEGR